MQNLKILRGSTLSFHSDPFVVGDENSYDFFEDALIFIDKGIIQKIGSYQILKKEIPINFKIDDYSGYLITPGFIDSHVHYPQTPMIGA